MNCLESSHQARKIEIQNVKDIAPLYSALESNLRWGFEPRKKEQQKERERKRKIKYCHHERAIGGIESCSRKLVQPDSLAREREKIEYSA